jgi:hypothetical protein
MWPSCVPLVGTSSSSHINTKKRQKSNVATTPKTRLRKGSTGTSSAYNSPAQPNQYYEQNENAKHGANPIIPKAKSWKTRSGDSNNSGEKRYGRSGGGGFLDRAFENASFIEFDDENQE